MGYDKAYRERVTVEIIQMKKKEILSLTFASLLYFIVDRFALGNLYAFIVDDEHGASLTYYCIARLFLATVFLVLYTNIASRIKSEFVLVNLLYVSTLLMRLIYLLISVDIQEFRDNILTYLVNIELPILVNLYFAYLMIKVIKKFTRK